MMGGPSRSPRQARRQPNLVTPGRSGRRGGAFPPQWCAPGPPGGRLRLPAGAPSVNIKLFTRRLASLRSVSWSRSLDRARWRVTQEGAIGLGLGSGACGSDDANPCLHTAPDQRRATLAPASTKGPHHHPRPAQSHSSACRPAPGSQPRPGPTALKIDSAKTRPGARFACNGRKPSPLVRKLGCNRFGDASL